MVNTDPSSETEDKNAIAKKKSLIMTLGNAKELQTLIEMLQFETNQSLIEQIIIVLGAMGKPKAINPLENLIETTDSEHIKKRASEAIGVIKSLSRYQSESD